MLVVYVAYGCFGILFVFLFGLIWDLRICHLLEVHRLCDHECYWINLYWLVILLYTYIRYYNWIHLALCSFTCFQSLSDLSLVRCFKPDRSDCRTLWFLLDDLVCAADRTYNWHDWLISWGLLLDSNRFGHQAFLFLYKQVDQFSLMADHYLWIFCFH